MDTGDICKSFILLVYFKCMTHSVCLCNMECEEILMVMRDDWEMKFHDGPMV